MLPGLCRCRGGDAPSAAADQTAVDGAAPQRTGVDELGIPLHEWCAGVESLLHVGCGLYAADREGHTARVACPKIQVANATGGGDAAAAALAACIAHGKPLAETARLAIGAGALACTASETIHPGMSWENIRYILDKEEL